MKRIKKFSQLFNKPVNENSENVNASELNEGLAEDVIKKLGYKNLKEIQKQKNLLMKLESIAKEISKKDKENTKNISEEGDEMDLDLDLDLDTDTEETPEEEPKEEAPKEEAPEEEPKEEAPKKEKSGKILSFDEFVSGQVSESVETERFYSLSEIVEKYKDIDEKLEGHAKKMKEDGASDEEIKDMHPEVSDEDLKEELTKADVKKMVDDETKGLEKKIKKAEDKAEKAEDKAEKAEDTAEEAEKEADKAEKEASKGDDIKSDKEFEEYGMDVLKQAHPDDFDEATAKKVIDGLIKKYKGDYGAMIGALTSGFGG